MMTDPIADMLTRIRNGQMAKKNTIEMPFSKVKFALAQILASEGYIAAADRVESKPADKLSISLKYVEGRPAIQSIKRESKPGHRMYKKANELPKILNGYGMAIVSTPRGMMTAHSAKKEGVGGEVICSVY